MARQLRSDPNPMLVAHCSRCFSSHWPLVDLVRKLRRIITLTELKTHPELAGLPLLKRGNRLSVMPVSPAHWDFILWLE